MHDTSKTKSQLIDELQDLREQVAALEASQTDKLRITQQGGNEATFNVIEAMADPLILLDLDGRFLFVNKAHERMSGYKQAQVTGRHFSEFLQEAVKEEELDEIRQVTELAFGGKHTPPVEFTFVTTDGREAPLSASASFINNEKGDPWGVVVTFRDVTDIKRAERTLRESEERFRALFEGSLDAIFVFDPASGRILDANPAASELLSRPLLDIVGMHYTKLAPSRLEQSMRTLFERQMAESDHGRPIETTLVSSDGTEVPVELLAQIIQVDGVPVLVATFRSLTDRKRTEEALRHSEERYRLLAQNSPDIITIINPDNSFRYISPAAERILGYTPDEVIERMGFDHVHPEDRAPVVAAYARLLESPDELLNVQYRLRRKDGSWRFVEAVAINVLANPAMRAIVLNVRDITDRKQLEEKFRRSVERHRLLVRNSSDIIVLLDPDGKVRYTNPALEKSLGYTSEEMSGQTAFDYIHPEDMTNTMAGFERCLKNPGQLILLQYRFRHKDGSWRVHESVGNNLLNHPALGAIIVNCRDITERKRMEETLEKAEKLESLGILCGGIAHDFNNILTAVLTNISMAQMYGALEKDIQDMLADAEKASLRGKGLTQQLLTFAKGGEPIKKTVLIPTLIQDTVDFALSGSNVRCEHDLPEDLWPVEADEGQIGQVIQNVILNADQAMPGGGVIRVHAENVTITEEDPLPLEPGHHVKISITDQGLGIPEDHLQKIFDPFFTTKQKGSGLGLSTSFSIVKRHNGALRVESRLGGGTKVHVYLPALPEGATKRGAKRDASYRGEGRVLLIDDDDTLRRAIGQALRRLGYEVESAQDGAEGIKIYQEAVSSGRPIDVVVMDLTIPGGMGGKEAAQELLRIDPDAKLIVSSGYSTDPVMSDFRAHGFRAVITKPYRIEDLGETLLKVMTGE